MEEVGSDADGYRDAAEGRRRIVHVHAAIPLWVSLTILASVALVVAALVVASLRHDLQIQMACVALLPGIVFVGLTPRIVWRRLQWVRFELTRRALVTHTGPLGGKTTVEAWSARSPLSALRDEGLGKTFDRLRSWDLYVERDDGRRVQLATLHDEATLRFVTELLGETYRHAEPTNARHPFAVRFGPMPDDVSCEGDVDDPTATCHVDVRCPRGTLSAEVTAAVGLLVLAPFVFFMVFGVIGSLVVGTIGGIVALVTHDVPLEPQVWLCALIGVPMALGVGAAFFVALRDQLRTTVLRSRGHVHVELGPEGVDLHTAPWRGRAIPRPDAREKGPIRLEVTPLARNPAEAKLEVIHARERKRPHAPIGTDAARYVAKIADAYAASRSLPS